MPVAGCINLAGISQNPLCNLAANDFFYPVGLACERIYSTIQPGDEKIVELSQWRQLATSLFSPDLDIREVWFTLLLRQNASPDMNYAAVVSALAHVRHHACSWMNPV